ncbi:MAG: helix-turn-helix domain-containing protein [Limimaricola sp.]|nr:helix-turn-helix domain-containing protein [Limimaricola sp.]
MAQTPKKPRGRPRLTFSESSAGTMQALDRALIVLSALARAGHASLTDLSLAVGVPAPTTHRILTTLQKQGYAAFDEATQHWMVGLEAYRTGTAYLARTSLQEVGRPVMRRLMEATGETANLAVPDTSGTGAEVVFVGQVETPNPIRAFFAPGTRTAMHASGTGKAILATLDEARVRRMLERAGLPRFTPATLTEPAAFFADMAETRARGWSFDREERYLGMCCIGAAIFDARGEAVAGISISGPTSRFDPTRIAGFGEAVRDAARTITEGIGGSMISAD